MRRMVFYAHAGAGNHGCEAIVRASARILREPVRLYSMNRAQDCKYRLDEAVEIMDDTDTPLARYSAKWVQARAQTKLTGSIEKEIYYRKQSMLSKAKKGDVWLSIGGDNYCYPGTEILAAENEILSKRGARTVLWGCSVEPALLKRPEIAKDLARYDLITARETISYEALKTVNPNTVLVSDPAFTLERRDLPLPAGWQAGNMVGVNVSPLILQNAKDDALAFEAYAALVQYILDETPYGIALIPHVVWEYNDDREPLRALYDRFADTGRVVMIEDHNCMELKGYIARCRFFVGARTHATIAAYSSCVPTLVVGYSTKSRGIARDLFGTEEHYVLPVQQLRAPDELAGAFRWLLAHEGETRARLERVMPAYQSRAYRARDAVKRLG